MSNKITAQAHIGAVALLESIERDDRSAYEACIDEAYQRFGGIDMLVTALAFEALRNVEDSPGHFAQRRAELVEDVYGFAGGSAVYAGDE
ncbi:hypothetical protein [Gordonia malaquae]|uniref:hypothetical protein n=1 Tax=Gordonia malaquae TaxID=410332 RepID=UPI0030165F5C